MNSLRTGWLSPSGEFVYCKTYEHISVAESIAANHPEYEYIDPRKAQEWNLREDDLIIDNGWVHITTVLFMRPKPEWHITWSLYRRLTSAQRKFLEPYFISGSIDELSLDRWKRECD